jgi:hypothetical protein
MRYLKTYKLFESVDKIAGVWDSNEKFEDGDDFKIKFKVSDIIELAKDKPVEELDPKSINYDFSGRQEDPTETKQRVMNADLSYPIIVVQNEQGRIFTMLDGTHRLEKALILGLDKIRVKVMSKEELIQFKVDDFDKLIENINIPIKVGDVVLGGRFKNKRLTIKKIGKNDEGDITINSKPILKYRTVKESASYDKLQEDVEDYLAHLNDDFKIEVAGSQLVGNTIRNNYYVRIWKQKDKNKPYNFNNCVVFKWSDIEEEVLRFISIIEENWTINYLYGISQIDSSDWYNGSQSHEHRTMFTKNELSNLNGDSELKSFVIGLVKEVEKLTD